MNICFICREYPPAPRVGGIGSATRDTAHALVRLGHRVHVVAPAWHDRGASSDAGVVVHRVRAPRWQAPGVARRMGQTLDRMGWSWAAGREVRRLHRSEGLDLVEAPEFAAEGHGATRVRSLTVVIRLHTPLALVRRLNGTQLRFDCRRTIRLERAAVARAAAVTAPSRAIAAACAEAGYGQRTAEARIIPSGVDTSLFCPAPVRRDGSHEPLVLLVGRMEARKGIGDFLEALPKIAAAVPDARFAFVGADTQTAPGGWWFDEIQWLARESSLEDRVVVAGFVSPERLPDWYRRAQVVVAPSPFEAFGLVYLEAMACGRPVVGCSAGAFPEIVMDARGGRAVPPHDPGALAGAVIDLLEDPKAAGEMGERARRRVEEQFSIERAAAMTAGFYEEILSGGAA